MMHTSRVAPVIRILLTTALVAPTLIAAPPAFGADGNPASITVTGSGDAKGRPDVVEMTAMVSGEAELAADAVVKYRDTKRRAVKAVEDLKIASLAIESRGFTLNQGIDPNQQQMMMRGMAPTSTKQRVQVSESMRIVLRGVDKMKDDELMGIVLKVIDAGKDAGLVIGASGPMNSYQYQMMMQRGGDAMGMATFKVTDPAKVREEAYAKAIQSARAKAERLAALSGVKLGRVLSVQDNVVQTQTAQVVYVYGTQQQAAAEGELTSSVAGDITLNVRLTVQFAIAE